MNCKFGLTFIDEDTEIVTHPW